MSELETDTIPGFTIHSLIATGGMARVYLATQQTLDRKLALKVMDGRKDRDFAERFLNEGRLIASLHHPNIITIHDLGRLDDGRVYIAMEYIDGETLEHRLSRPVGADQAVSILRNLAECLAYVHEHGVIHRDIKPANILYRKDGTMVLTDFGIAKQIDSDSNITREGDMIGSPGYMSPEQAQAKAIDHRTDLYSAGVIFAEMLLGLNSFKADSYIETSMNHIQMEVPQLDDNLSEYQFIVDKLLAKSPHERMANAKALIFALDQIAVEDDLSDWQLSQIKMPKKGLLARFDTLLLLVFLLVFLGTGGYFFQQAMVKSHLQKADMAYANDRLMLPEDDNAVHYYQQVLSFSPNNYQAQQGLYNVGERYAVLTEQALRKKQKRRAKKLLQRGLKASPEHPRLKALQQRLQ